MKSKATLCAALGAAFVIAVNGGCGNGTEGEEADRSEAAVETQQAEPSLPIDTVPYDSVIEAAGYEVVYFRTFPASEAGRRGRLILYASASGGKDGGAVFVEQWGTTTQWVWHWYFEDARPEAYTREELNQDGLWDIRIVFENGDRVDLIHDDTFALLGRGREDRIALNGTSSTPLEGHPLWHCFDGDLRSSWQSEIGGEEVPFIEVASPLGLSEGILSIRAASDGQPRQCHLYADGDRVQSIELQATRDEQLVQLDPKLNTAKKIKLEIESCHGDCGAVAIAELQIK